MKRRIIFSLISLILAVAMVITALSSCSADNSSLILCNVKLEEDEDSRRLTSTVSSNTISATAIYYHPEYLGTGSSYSEINSDKTSITDDVTGEKYILYNDGILLSQGLWNIKCKWTDESGKTVLEGETGPTWINLNTEKLYVRFGECSLSLTYSVTCKETISPYIVLNMYSYENGNISSSGLSGYENKILNIGSSTTVSTETTSSGTVKILKHSFSYDFSSFNQAGSFVIVLQIKDTNKNDVLFTDVIGFVSRSGNTTALKGSCEITDSNVGGSSVYLPEISDPTDPIRGSTGEVIEITNTPENTDDGTTQAKLNEVVIKDDKVYVLIPDKDENGSDTNSMDLGHTMGENLKDTNRIVTPLEGTDFGINMKGTDVIVTIGGDGVDSSKENTTIIELNKNVSMTLYNYASPDRDATWGLVEPYITGNNGDAIYRRYQCNTSLVGGTLNVVGPNSRGNSISNGAIVFRGPLASDNMISGYNGFCKQGAINITSNNNSSGGNIVLDGNVTVEGVTGISSWQVNQSGNLISGYKYVSSIAASLNTNISILNNARINAEGNSNSTNTAYGIYIMGNSAISSGGIINITLDNGHIITNSSGSTDESGIRVDNFYNGTINITLKNGATINSDVGSGLYFNNCKGTNINITIESDYPNDAIQGATNRIRLAGTNGTVTLNVISSSGSKKTKTIKSSISNSGTLVI